MVPSIQNSKTNSEQEVLLYEGLLYVKRVYGTCRRQIYFVCQRAGVPGVCGRVNTRKKPGKVHRNPQGKHIGPPGKYIGKTREGIQEKYPGKIFKPPENPRKAPGEGMQAYGTFSRIKYAFPGRRREPGLFADRPGAISRSCAGRPW